MATIGILPRANYKNIVGVVVNAGERLKTVRVRVPHQTWNERIKKFYDDPYHLLVHDPTRACNTGDVIRLRSGWRVSKHVKHVVTDIVKPFGTPVSARPAVLTEEERQTMKEAKRKQKDERQAARGRMVSALRLEMNKKLEIKEQTEEGAAREVLTKKNKLDALKHTAAEILLRENDLDVIEKRVRDVILLQLPEQYHWAADAGRIDPLTIGIAFLHASAKQRYIGAEIPLKAGKSESSFVRQQNIKIAEVMMQRGHKFLNLGLSQKEGRNTIWAALQRLRLRLTDAWKATIFETRDPDASAARIEKLESRLRPADTSSAAAQKDWQEILKQETFWVEHPRAAPAVEEEEPFVDLKTFTRIDEISPATELDSEAIPEPEEEDSKDGDEELDFNIRKVARTSPKERTP
jgi:small subunit ribosomal protein S17